jgi:MYXO-CTERM domain-containing protein
LGRSRGRRLFFATIVALLSVFIAAPAFARGSVRVSKTRVKEKDGEWKLKFTVNYGSKPHLNHIPMVFSFKQNTLFERYVDDSTGDTPATRRVPVHNATPIDLPMDVGFADMSGKTHKITKFKMKLTREHDFEAGEYTLKVRLASGGAVGRPIKVTLDGNNKVINRKSIAFTAPEPKKGKTNEEPKEQDLPEPKSGAAEDFGPDLSDIPDISDSEAEAIEDANTPDGVEPKQGGCGCEVVGQSASTHASWALVALGAALALRRRRQG